MGLGIEESSVKYKAGWAAKELINDRLYRPNGVLHQALDWIGALAQVGIEPALALDAYMRYITSDTAVIAFPPNGNILPPQSEEDEATKEATAESGNGAS